MKRLLLVLAALAAVAASAGCGKAIDYVLGIKEYSQQELRGIATDALAAVSSPEALANDCAVAVACRQSDASDHLDRVLQAPPGMGENDGSSSSVKRSASSAPRRTRRSSASRPPSPRA